MVGIMVIYRFHPLDPLGLHMAPHGTGSEKVPLKRARKGDLVVLPGELLPGATGAAGPLLPALKCQLCASYEWR